MKKPLLSSYSETLADNRTLQVEQVVVVAVVTGGHAIHTIHSLIAQDTPVSRLRLRIRIYVIPAPPDGTSSALPPGDAAASHLNRNYAQLVHSPVTHVVQLVHPLKSQHKVFY